LPVTSPAPLEDDEADLLEEVEDEQGRDDEQLFMASLQRGEDGGASEGGTRK
jgi:hypothetical protein